MRFRIAIAEVATGIIIRRCGARFLRGEETPYIQFENEEQARNFAQDYIERHPDRECMLYLDGHDVAVDIFRQPYELTAAATSIERAGFYSKLQAFVACSANNTTITGIG